MDLSESDSSDLVNPPRPNAGNAPSTDQSPQNDLGSERDPAKTRASNVSSLVQANKQLQAQLSSLIEAISANESEAENLVTKTAELRKQTEEIEIDISEKESVLESTQKVSFEVEAQYSKLLDRIPDLEREISELESVRREFQEAPNFQAILAKAQQASATLREQLREREFEISDKEAKLKRFENETDDLVAQFKAENSVLMDLQARLDEFEVENGVRSVLAERHEVVMRQREEVLQHINTLKRQSKATAGKIHRHKMIADRVFAQSRALKSELSQCNARLKQTKKAIINLHRRLDVEDSQLVAEYEERIAREQSKIGHLRQLRKNFRVEVDSLQAVVTGLEKQKLSVRDVISKQSSEIDELKMRMRVSEETARWEQVFNKRDKEKRLLSHLEEIERNHDEIVELFHHNRVVRGRLLGDENQKRGFHTRIFTHHLLGRPLLRVY
jgi:chromosome segregation ATPase